MKLVEFLLYIIVNLINITMIIQHIIPVMLVDTYTITNDDNTETIGKLTIYKHCYQTLFGDSRIN